MLSAQVSLKQDMYLLWRVLDQALDSQPGEWVFYAIGISGARYKIRCTCQAWTPRSSSEECSGDECYPGKASRLSLKQSRRNSSNKNIRTK